MNKTVLHILNTNSYSGAENVVIAMVDAFRKYKYHTNFVYVSYDGPIRSILEKHSIVFEPISKMCVSEIKRVAKKYNPDIVHAHDFTASIVCSVAVGKIPVISHIHNNSPWIKKYCINSWVYGLSCLKYKKILGVSASVFDEYVFGKVIRNKSDVIGNPIDILKIQQFAGVAEDNEGFDVVFLGRLSEQKNPMRFLDVISRVKEQYPKISAVMIGDGEMRQNVENRIRELELGDNISLKGFVLNPYGILKNSKMLCIPSKWEGFGLVAVEALALAKPVLATPVGGLPGIVTSECGSLAQSDDKFADEIVNLCSNKGYLEKKSRKALERAKKMDNIERYIRIVNKVYDSVKS